MSFKILLRTLANDTDIGLHVVFVGHHCGRNAHFCQKSTEVDWQVDHVYSSQSVD